MRLVLLFDHRFRRSTTSVAFSLQNYNAGTLSSRYLQDFTSIEVIGRIDTRPVSEYERRERVATAQNITLTSVGNFDGLNGIMLTRRIEGLIESRIQEGAAFLAVSPGIIGLIGARWLRRRGYPYGVELVGDAHEVFSGSSFRHPLKNLLASAVREAVKRQVRAADTVAYVTKRTLQRKYPPARSSFSTHYSSVELPTEAYREPHVKIRTSDSPFRILSIGTFEQLYKGQDILIRALAAVREENASVFLTLVGDGKHRRSIQALAEHLGINRAVVFTGQVSAGDEVRSYIDQADLFVLPSRTEGLPRVLLEAMARGVPCIATSVGGIPELLPADALVPVDNPRALSERILHAIRTPEWLNRMSMRNFDVSTEYRLLELSTRRRLHYRRLRSVTEGYLERARAPMPE